MLGCVTTPATQPPPARSPTLPDPSLRPEPVPPEDVFVSPEERTVEDAFILDLYTWLHRKDYETFRIWFPGSIHERSIAHLLIPPGPGPHPTVVVFPILAGSHTVSEMLAKTLVNRGFLVARLERPKMELDTTEDTEEPVKALRSALMDARRLLDILEWREDVDRTRIAAAGVSVGGILACLLHGTDPRVSAGFYIMPGGDVARILSDSTERPIRAFRNNLMKRESLDVEGFVARMQPLLADLDPMRFAPAIDPASVFLASSRFDRVIRPPHAEKLWESLGRPRWTRMPIGHYQLLPLFWWVVNRGADHLDTFFADRAPAPPASPTDIPEVSQADSDPPLAP